MYENIKTVIFDMDGVLFDSEKLDKKAWENLAETFGVEDIIKAFEKCIGTPDENIMNILQEYIDRSRTSGSLREPDGVVLSGAKFRQQTLEVFDRFVEEYGMPLKYYASECLENLKNKGYRLGLASSTPVERVRKQLSDTGLLSFFDDIVGGGMFKKGKPDPEIFLMSCKRLGTPSETVVIEDSFNGIRAAYSAGMEPIMVPDIVPPDEEMKEKSWKILKNLKEVTEIL